MVLIMASASYAPVRQSTNPFKNDPVAELRRQRALKKKELEAEMKRLEKKLEPLMDYTVEELELALRIKVMKKYEGAVIRSDERNSQYLGIIADEFAPDSIFNEFDKYGAPFYKYSIWNEFSTYGAGFSNYSPSNPFATNPPLIVKDKKIIGRLTVIRTIPDAVDPGWLKLYFRY
jgi:type I site-specific restriction endonuclease